MERSAIEAIVSCKCPRCRQGDMFAFNSLMPSKFSKVNEKCSHCGLRFEREPGFFTGAMYVSYAFNVAIVVAVFVALNILQIDNLVLSIVLVMGIIIGLVPVFFRYSRVLFLHIFGNVKYEAALNQ